MKLKITPSRAILSFAIALVIGSLYAVSASTLPIQHHGRQLRGVSYPQAYGVTYQTASLAGLVANTPVNVIPAMAGKTIVVVGYSVSSNVAGSTVVFQDEAVSPNILDGCTFAANDHIQVNRGQGIPVFQTVSGAALDIAITGTSDVVKGSITYFYQ